MSDFSCRSFGPNLNVSIWVAREHFAGISEADTQKILRLFVFLYQKNDHVIKFYKFRGTSTHI